MTTTTYYISYEERRRPPWRLLLLILLIIIALGLLAGIAYGIYALVSADRTPEREPVPLGRVLMSFYRDEHTATAILTDSTQSIADADGANLEYVQAELLSALNSPVSAGQSTGQVALATFAQVEREDVNALRFHKLDEQTVQAHQSKVAAIRPENRPSFIYDTIATAYEDLTQQGDLESDRAIVVVTDGDDGGYLVVDPTRLAPCGPDIPAVGPDEVCSPIAITISIDLEALRPCPPDLPIAHGNIVCMPVGDAANDYYLVDPADVMPCPDGPPDNLCAEIIVDYEPVNPNDVEQCPPALDVAPEQACVDLRSEITRDELLTILASADPPAAVIHTIGLGDTERHDNLRLIAAATGGDYYHCTRRGCTRPD